MSGAFAGPLTLQRPEAPTPGPTELAQPAPALARVVAGIVSYTRWPGGVRPIRVCVAAAGPFGAEVVGALATHREGPPVDVRRIAVDLPPPADCDALVAEGWQTPALRAVLQDLSGRPVLTIGISAMACHWGSHFCLRLRLPGAHFSVNRAALARSGLMATPRLLQLARPLETPPPETPS